MIDILIADDHSIVRNGLKLRLENEPDIRVVGETENGKELLPLIENNPTAIILLDITMPIMDGIATLKEIQKKGWNTNIIMLSMHNNEEYVLNTIELGAKGYLLKDNSSEELITAIHTVSQGKRYYSTEVSQIMASGYLNKLHQIDKPETKNSNSTLSELFSKRELEVLACLKQGMSNKEIAEKLDLSIRTVEVHRFNMMKKTKSKNLIELLNKV